jgi:hypothetical protein
MFSSRLRMSYVFVSLIALGTAGCAAKARTLRVGVSQFLVESIAAINAIDEMHNKEIAPPGRTSAEAANAFVDNAIQSRKPATEKRVSFWLDPNRVEISQKTAQAWSEFTESLRNQYATFARIFDEIEQASFTGRTVVEKSVSYIEDLIA